MNDIRLGRRWHRGGVVRLLCYLLAPAVLAGCAELNRLGGTLGGDEPAFSENAEAPALARPAREQDPTVTVTPVADDITEAPRPDITFNKPGSGLFTRPPRKARLSGAQDTAGRFTLNFQETNLLEVVKVVLSDLLKVNYVVDPKVQGSVTLQTSKPLGRDALIPTLEMLLRMNGAALVFDGETYTIVPRENAIQGLLSPQLGDVTTPLPNGFGVRIAPLRFIGAEEMGKILEPFVTPGALVRVDTQRNLLILAGTSGELARLLETIDVFDVDWIAGMSVGLFTPEYVDTKTLAEELENVFGLNAETPLSGMMRFVTIERLNALLVITPKAQHLQTVTDWIDRLDRESGDVGQRLYIYHVQNGKATELADVLNQLFVDSEDSTVIPPAELAPGLTASTIGSVVEPPASTATDSAQQSAAAPVPPAVPARRPAADQRASSKASEGLAVTPTSRIRIIADEPNNALLILATGQEYRQLQAALERLDIVPLQVLIEATIAEITLTDELEHGLEWFFKNNIGSKRGTATLDIGAAGLAALAPGFSYAFTDAAGVVRAVLNTLASDSRLNVISSPSVMVQNNQEARIQVGDEVPIITQQQQSTDANANIINTIEFRDTGVLLVVTPRVNAGGLVSMEIQQEVSDVAPGTGANLTPTIQQRFISSTVAIESGQTVVLGGLIRENRTLQRSGFPGLYRLPVIGSLFGTTNDDKRRTELVILITPRAVRNAGEADRITREFRDKMQSLKPYRAPGRADPAQPKS